MRSGTRTLILLLIVFFLITACGSADSETRKTPFSTFTNDIANMIQSPELLQDSPTSQATITPQDLRTLYGVDSLIQRGFTGKGQTVIVPVVISNPTLQQDMNIFDQKFNLPPIDLQVIPPPHITPQQAALQAVRGWMLESQMDVEAIHSLAPEAKIIVLQKKDGLSMLIGPQRPPKLTPGAGCDPSTIEDYQELFQLVSYTINHQLGYIISYSGGATEEWYLEHYCMQQFQQWNSFLQQATTQHHITFFFPSDDTGGTVSFLANSPWVVGVGGTILQSVDSTLQETGWKESGGGFSDLPVPSYQKILPAKALKQFIMPSYVRSLPYGIPAAQLNQVINQRRVPDVSAMAYYPQNMAYQGFPIYLSGQWEGSGGSGTSLSTPIWAAIAAIANQMSGHPLGFINPGLYKLAISPTYQQDFHDITKGDNRVYFATPGWDPVTGLGTPNAEKLLPDLIAALK